MVATVTEVHKKAAVQFLKLVVSGQIEDAYRTFVDMKGKHHNPFFPAGFATLKKGMQENQDQMPNKQIKVKNVLADGDLVAVHSELVLNPGNSLIVVHLFRFEEDKIVEMWDCGQAVPADSPNKDGVL